MKQLVQNIRTGESIVEEVPAPNASPGRVLIAVAASLVSAGTERMIVDFASKNVLEKARSRPDLVRQTIEKARRDGILSTIEAVQNRLDQPIALGYSVAGTVIEVGVGVTGLAVGDRVAAAGAAQAVHAEFVAVPQNLVVRIPDGVDFDAAAFTTLGAIALQGVRLAEPRLGEVVGVLGLGLLGQITAQLLRANGCRVIAFDPQRDRAELALRLGVYAAVADEAEFKAVAGSLTAGRGVDSVLITADTKSDGPVIVAGDIARDKGLVVAVGAVGLNIPRKTYYEKELDFRISRSYGPGRYDDSYEQDGIDYPYAYVRWTENRNMEAFLQLVQTGSIDLAALTTHRIDITEGARAYDVITGKSGEAFLGVVLRYPRTVPDAKAIGRHVDVTSATLADSVRVGFLGAGQFAKAVLMPAFRDAGVEMIAVAAATGSSSRHAAQRFGFRYCTTEARQVFEDDRVNTVVIATRHDLHAAQVIRALEAGRHVFVEKPLCLDGAELDAIRVAHGARPGSVLMVGFNRRFAPMATRVREFIGNTGEPLLIHYRVNGGFIPRTEWVHTEQGGGRLVGEGVHFIDWAVWLTGDVPVTVYTAGAANAGRYSDDNLSVTVRFRAGSVLQLLYVASGDRAVGKERIEVHSGGRSAIVEDFRKLELVSKGRRKVDRSILRSDKGHRAAVRAFADAIRGARPSPIPFAQIVDSMRATFAARESLDTARVVEIR